MWLMAMKRELGGAARRRLISSCRGTVAAVLLTASLVGCSATTRLATPPQLGDGWQVGNVAAAGFDAAAMAQLTEDLTSGVFTNTHAVLIEYDGRLVYEQYLPGTDERWGEPLGPRLFGRDSLHDLRSVTKSITSLILGIALAGEIAELLDEPLISYFPDLQISDGLEAVTLHHALTMTAGLEWNEMTVPYTDPANDEVRLYSVENPVGYVLSRPARDAPGALWYYNGGLTQVLADIVQRVSGKSLDVYAEEALFVPLGIKQFEWLGEPTWNPPMPSAASGLRMRPRDLAKVGSLILHGGRWHGRQIVPSEWVSRSKQRYVENTGDWSGGIWGYGYQWWIGEWPGGHQVIAALGNGNQSVFVVSGERLVVTILAGEYNKMEPRHSEQILNRILAARAARTGVRVNCHLTTC